MAFENFTNLFLIAKFLMTLSLVEDKAFRRSDLVPIARPQTRASLFQQNQISRFRGKMSSVAAAGVQPTNRYF